MNHDYFNTIDTEAKAYWLGLLFADGYNYEARDRVVLTLAQTDIEILERFARDIGYVNQIYTVIPKLPNCQPLRTVTINSRTMSEALARLGCVQRKSLILEIPSIPDDLMRHFMRGYFDGDGCIYLKERDDGALVIECPIVCSPPFAAQLADMLLGMGIRTYSQEARQAQGECDGQGDWAAQ